MEAFEERALRSFPLQPKLWLKYADDTFVVPSHSTEALGDFHKHLNTQDQAYTVHHQRRVGGGNSFPWYICGEKRIQANNFGIPQANHHRQTHSFQFSSPPMCSDGVIQCLRDRVNNICNRSNKNELIHPRQSVPDVTTTDVTTTDATTTDATTTDVTTSDPKLLFIPYIQGVSEKIERVCQRLGVRAVFKSGNTTRQTLTRVKN